MAKAFIRTLLAGDIEYVAARMRAADRQEVTAASGLTDMLQALGECVMRSSEYWVLATAREPLAVFGVSPISLLGGTGSPWLLGTEETFRHPSTLIREGRRYVQRMLALFPHLINYVDARNIRSVRWLARIGFQIHPAAPYGAAGLPFHKFERRA